MKELWDKRYSSIEYVYGTNGNEFLKQSIVKYGLKGKALFPAEGEGRNAVYAAKCGFEVSAFDISEQAKLKALKLANYEQVVIDYQVGNVREIHIEFENYDVVALIFAHMSAFQRVELHRFVGRALKTGGVIILEAFSKNNLPLRIENPLVGGPDKLELLFSTEEILEDFKGFEIISLEEVETELSEGTLHNGIAKVIRFIGRKK